MKKGIDISSHNGEIDMKKVKDSGVEFIILRLGYGKNKSQIDKRFYENYKKAKDLKIPVGVYLYSYAYNRQDAISEAKLVIDEIKDLEIEYPIFLDMEDADNYKLKHFVTNQTCIEICETFCNRIEEAGYYVGIYANLNWLTTRISSNRLDRFDKWVAQWSNKCDYKKPYGIWQYTSKGVVPGINGYVDLNYSLKDYEKIIKNTGLNHLKAENLFYIVQDGDNLSKIANKYGTSWQKIYNDNKELIGDNPNLIIPGQKLIIKVV